MTAPVAVTGATGFIGGALVRHLDAAGFRVRALVRPGSSGTSLPPAVERVQGSLEDVESLHRLMGGAAAVVHCAGRVRGAAAADFLRANAEGTARLGEVAARQQRVPRVVFVSSLAARRPDLSSYAASKRRAEEALAGATGAWTILRPPAVYGPGDRELGRLLRWMGRGIAPVLAPAGARFSLLYVEDLAGAIVRLLVGEPGTGRVFELHDGRPGGYRWADVVAAVARWRRAGVFRLRVPPAVLRVAARLNLLAVPAWRRAPMLTPGKVRELLHPDWVCDNAALTGSTGWTPRVDFDEGLRRTLGPARGSVSPPGDDRPGPERVSEHADLRAYSGRDD